MEIRAGHGYDVHKLLEGRKLILGGVEIAWEKGLLGHSDADVLVHAVMDSLLGAAALGDIGKHFLDTDPQYKGADSIELLKHVSALLHQQGYTISNIDATVIAQKPKLIFRRCARILPMPAESRPDRSMSRRPPRKIWDLPEAGKE